MHRFWFDSAIDGQQVVLKSSLFHHICRVCRFDTGDSFILVSPGGLQYTVELEKRERDSAVAKVIKVEKALARKKPHIHVALSCPRFSVLENLLKKFVELDISDLHLFVSDFSFIKKVNSLPETRLKRWESILQHSMAQSLSSRGFKIQPLVDMKTLCQTYQQQKKAKALFFYEGKSCKTIYESLSQLGDLDQVWLFLGGEGGFSQKEVQAFEDMSISSTSIGNPILKVETACLTAISLVKYECKLF